METIAVYLLKSTVILTVFYLFYRLFLANDHNFKLLRFYFYAMVVFSLILPLNQYSIELPAKKQKIVKSSENQSTIQVSSSTNNQTPIESSVQQEVQKEETHFFSWKWLSYIYLALSTFLFLKLLITIATFILHAATNKRKQVDGITIVQSESSKGSYSFMHWVFLNENNLRPEEISSILAHEKIHVKQRHTIDLIMIELLTAVMWFNPVIWMMRKSLQQLHEFLADEGVLNAGIDKFQYQSLLLNLVAEEKLITLSSNFNHSLIKKRIQMMTLRKTNQKTKVKVFLALPVALAFFLAFSCLNGQTSGKDGKSPTSDSTQIATSSISNEIKLSSPSKDTSNVHQKQNVVSVSPVKMNVLYLGVDNPLIIAASDFSPEKLEVTTSNGTIKNFLSTKNGKVINSGYYIVNPKKIGNAIITILSDNKTLGMWEFRVKTIPDPVAKVAGKKGGEIDKNELLQQKKMWADLEGFDFDARFNIVEFTVTASIGGFVQECRAKSNELTQEQIDLISKLNVGDKVYFQDIKCVGPDGKIRDLNAVYFKIK